MTDWFTSDQHYGHYNIVKFCNRPFKTTQEMNEKLIENHNRVVGKNDRVFFGGDVAFKIRPSDVANILKQLNGKKYIIAGNHDKAILKRDSNGNIIIRPEIESYVEWIKDYHELTIQDSSIKHGNKLIVLTHYAMRVWNKSHWGAWNLYGHSHGTLPEDESALSIDIGVDAVAKRLSAGNSISQDDYRPISYEEIKHIMESKNFKPIR